MDPLLYAVYLEQIQIEADVPRTPGVPFPSADSIFSAPSLPTEDGKPLGFITSARCDTGTDGRLPAGEAMLVSQGLIFFATGHPNESPVGESLGEAVRHSIWHLFGAVGSAALSAVQAKRDVARMMKSPDTFVIPAPAITGMRLGSPERDLPGSLIVSCEDEEGTRGTYTFVPSSGTPKALGRQLWLMRFLFELGMTHLDLVSRFVPPEAWKTFMGRYYVAYFKRPNEFEDVMQEVRSAMPALGDRFPSRDTWMSAVCQTYYHLQRFRSLPWLVREFPVEWGAVDTIEALCFSCGTFSAPRSHTCTNCGNLLY
jgi:hypothetical protein